MKKPQLLAILAMAAAAFTAQAQFVEINISSQCNQDLQTFTSGNNYPLGGTKLYIRGIPFVLGFSNNVAGTTGAVQTPDGNQSYTFTVPPGTHANALYALMNTSWGMYGQNEGTLVVTGSHGETATLTLTDGINIRDHYHGFFQNTLSDPTVVETSFINGLTDIVGPGHLDRLELLLPSSFNGDTIASITFNGIDNGEPGGDPFLAALTLITLVPDPAHSESILNSNRGASVLASRK